MDRQFIVEQIHMWGGNTVVESLLDPACHIFSAPNAKGLIGYYENRRCVVAFGDPVCHPEEREELVQSFHAFCEKKKKNAVYLVASEGFAHWMHTKKESALIPFGEELYFDPQANPLSQTGKRGIALRGKLRHAEKNGITVSEYRGEIPELEKKIQEVATQWLKHRQGPQIYTSRVRLFSERFGKRWFYAHQENRLIGGVMLNYLQAKQGWALDRIMTVPDAPQGTSEILVMSVLETIAKEGCQFLTVGAINGATLGKIAGFGKWISFMTPHFYKVAVKFFNLYGKRKYWEKFHPQTSPAFLVFKQPRLGPYEIKGLLQALNVRINL